jgi:hypothetical protein
MNIRWDIVILLITVYLFYAYILSVENMCLCSGPQIDSRVVDYSHNQKEPCPSSFSAVI